MSVSVAIPTHPWITDTRFLRFATSKGRRRLARVRRFRSKSSATLQLNTHAPAPRPTAYAPRSVPQVVHVPCQRLRTVAHVKVAALRWSPDGQCAVLSSPEFSTPGNGHRRCVQG